MCSWFDGKLCERSLDHIDRWTVHDAEEVRCRVDDDSDSVCVVVHQRVCFSLIGRGVVSKAVQVVFSTIPCCPACALYAGDRTWLSRQRYIYMLSTSDPQAPQPRAAKGYIRSENVGGSSLMGWCIRDAGIPRCEFSHKSQHVDQTAGQRCHHTRLCERT